MISAFGYLAWCSVHNRIARQLRHLRSPRYLVALILGTAYLWFIVIGQRPGSSAATAPDPRIVVLVGSLALLGAVAWGWVFGVERRVLAFTPAEVTFLFSGPVSRRDLIQFKLLRSQLLILFNAMLWTLILSGEQFGVSSWLRMISIWVMLTTLSFHRLAASFVRTSLSEHGRLGLRHRVVSLSVLGAVVVALGWSLLDAVPELAASRDHDVQAFLSALADAAQRPVPSALMYPFRAMMHPLAAHTLGEWLASIGPALLLLGLHYIWVVRADTAFEEAAAEVSLRRARALTSGGAAGSGTPRSPARVRPPIIRLSATGWPAGALLWKNLVAVTRTRRVRNAALILGSAGAIVCILSFDPDGTLAEIAGWLAVFWAGLMIITGPQYIRNDLRGDLLKLDLLRSYPLRGWSVVLAEASASTLMLTAVQLALLGIGYLAFLGNQSMVPDLEERTALLFGSMVLLPAINLLGMLIQNGAALLYPAWVRLGSGRSAGVEALGQNLLMIVAFMALLSLTLVLPVAVGGGAFLLLRPGLEAWGLVPGIVLALGVIGFEAALMVDWLGRIFERMDPASAGISL
jgi:ABC-2 type transport system permease protein